MGAATKVRFKKFHAVFPKSLCNAETGARDADWTMVGRFDPSTCEQKAVRFAFETSGAAHSPGLSAASVKAIRRSRGRCAKSLV